MLAVCCVSVWTCLSTFAGPVSSASKELTKEQAAALTNSPLKQISKDIFEIGKVRLDKARRTVSFPAVVNMQEGLMEYVLVAEGGKLHESVLVTDAEPYHIHLAMLFLGANGAPVLKPEERVAEKEVKGEPVTIWAAWQTHGSAKRARIESFITNKEANKAMSVGKWTYNGSWVFEGTFIAQRERSIIALITDHDALVNNPRPGHDNDEMWPANKSKIPPPGTKITVTFELQPVDKQPASVMPAGQTQSTKP